MNLILDIGNTRAKVFLFDGREIVKRETLPALSATDLEVLLQQHPEVRHAILSSTVSLEEEVGDLLSSLSGIFVELGAETPLPIANRYRSKETLGYDRIAGVTEAHARYPGENVLVIDAGTALTYDLVTAGGVFVGGNISPGLQMRFRALADYTERLPLLTPEGPLPALGSTTEEAIRAGVIHGITEEIKGMIRRYKKSWEPLRTILTGGDAFFFDKKVKNSIFVLPDLTAYGLNRILEFNVQEQTH